MNVITVINAKGGCGKSTIAMSLASVIARLPPVPTVLVVDDHADTLELYRRLLGQKYKVLVAADMREALAAARTTDFALLVADLQLPDGDGWELPAKLRAIKGREVAAIAVSAHAHPDHQRRSLAAGYQQHVSKPVSNHDLVEAIDAAVAAAAGLRAVFGVASGD